MVSRRFAVLLVAIFLVTLLGQVQGIPPPGSEGKHIFFEYIHVILNLYYWIILY